jgi:hypothetical protein
LSDTPAPEPDPLLPHHLLEALMPFVGGEVIAKVRIGDHGPVAIIRAVLDRVETRDSKVAYMHFDESPQGIKIVVPAQHLIAVEPDRYDPEATQVTYVNGAVTIKSMRPQDRLEHWKREVDAAAGYRDRQQRDGRLRLLGAMVAAEADAVEDDDVLRELSLLLLVIDDHLAKEGPFHVRDEPPEVDDISEDWEW